MKLSIGKRILMFFHWLASLVACAALAICLIAPEFAQRLLGALNSALGTLGSRILGFALLALYVAVAAAQFYLIFNRSGRAERGFITMDSSDTGKVRIAMSALEQMVRQSVHSIDGIAQMKIDIENMDDAIGILVDATIINGSHVPTLTMNMQRSIRQFVEVNCGVAVRTVSISIDAVENQQESPARRRLGRMRTGMGRVAEKPDAAPEPQTAHEPPDAAAYGASDAVAYEATAPEAAFAQDADPAPGFPSEASTEPEEAPAYDPDKPYESEFAKDLAAMRAQEAADESAQRDVE